MTQSKTHIIEVQELLLVVADVEVDLSVWPTKFEGSQVIGQSSLLLGIKATKVDLLALLPDMSLPPLRPVLTMQTVLQRGHRYRIRTSTG